MRSKLGIVVPYRNRGTQLHIFEDYIRNYLNNTGLNYEVFVIIQDDAKLFNRGMLLNVGFKYAEKMKCNYVVFHDVDMLPVEVDYSYSPIPLHMATNLKLIDSDVESEKIFDEYFGGVTLFPVDTFKKINGYSNKYWGWGYEDTDLLYRCIKGGVELDNIKIKNIGKPSKAIKFNGLESHVKIRNDFDLDNNYTFFISFLPEDIICDYDKDSDYYTVFSIPGYDTSISFNSFSRYNFLTFDEERNALYVNSSIKTNYKTNIAVTIDNDNKKIRVFQDGHFIGEIEIKKKLLSYSYERHCYLGVGQPDRKGDERFFRGYITKFAVFPEVIKDAEILEIGQNEEKEFRENFGEYNSANKLIIYYDPNFIETYELKNLVSKKFTGKLYNCEIVDLNFDEYKTLPIPHRRKSLFATLPHEQNGFVNNKWKTQFTRWNQLRYYNEVRKDNDDFISDGLSDLEFIEVDKIKSKKITFINVGI
jgi:hypothetical protein